MATTKAVKIKTAGNKKKPVQKLKNVLAYPFPQYWPTLNDQQTDELKTFMLQLKQGESDKIENSPMIGLSQILREMNRNATVYFVLSTEIKPRFIANQIINLTLSRHKTCKVLCVPNLKQITKVLFEIESLAFGYKIGQCPRFENWISDKQLHWFPISNEILNYYSPLSKATESSTTQSSVTLRSKEVESKQLKINFDSLHLKRCTNQRAFVPSNAKTLTPLIFNEPKPEPATVWSDFISFSGKSHSNIEKMEIDDDSDCERDKQNLVKAIKKLISNGSNSNNVGTPSRNVDNNILGDISHEANGEKRKRKSDKGKEIRPAMPFSYIDLKVNRIQPNPDKSKKKKKGK